MSVLEVPAPTATWPHIKHFARLSDLLGHCKVDTRSGQERGPTAFCFYFLGQGFDGWWRVPVLVEVRILRNRTSGNASHHMSTGETESARISRTSLVRNRNLLRSFLVFAAFAIVLVLETQRNRCPYRCWPSKQFELRACVLIDILLFSIIRAHSIVSDSSPAYVALSPAPLRHLHLHQGRYKGAWQHRHQLQAAAGVSLTPCASQGMK